MNFHVVKIQHLIRGTEKSNHLDGVYVDLTWLRSQKILSWWFWYQYMSTLPTFQNCVIAPSGG